MSALQQRLAEALGGGGGCQKQAGGGGTCRLLVEAGGGLALAVCLNLQVEAVPAGCWQRL